MCGTFCHQTKASDIVNHDILITKLAYYGIAGKSGELVKKQTN
jgi:hypothetical protein